MAFNKPQNRNQKRTPNRNFGGNFRKPAPKKPDAFSDAPKPNPDEPEFNPEYEERLRLPKENEVLAVVERRLGGSRMTVKCFDSVSRIARIPGRLKRKLWIRENDVVLVEKWEYSQDKCDIIYKYSKNQVTQLKKQGYLDMLNEVEEF